MIQPGQTLYSKYDVVNRIAGGAMGDVWLVNHISMKRLHALKVIAPSYASNANALKRFQREFEVMATLRHMHAVTIYDACIAEDGGYIDMEYVEGQTIKDILESARNRSNRDRSEPLMPFDWLIHILDQLCQVLQFAHAKRIIHRDLKPSNLMLLGGRAEGDEFLKVLDFGIAKIRYDPDGAAAQNQDDGIRSHGFVGTPVYASPEQVTELETIDGRADLYAVGVLLYEFITGRVPFRGLPWQLANFHVNVEPPSFSDANPDLRPMPEVERIVLRILSKDPERRPQTAQELFKEFRDAVRDFVGPGCCRNVPSHRIRRRYAVRNPHHGDRAAGRRKLRSKIQSRYRFRGGQ